MAFNIGPTLTVQGEAEFNRQMTLARQEMKYLSAEANAAVSVFGKNEKSVESLTVRNQELQKALLTQEKAAKAIRSAMEEMTKEGLDPSSEKYKQLKANLDNTTAAANKTRGEIKENETAMVELQKKSSGLGDTVANLATKFGVVLPEGANKAVDALNMVDASTVVFIATAAKMVKKLAECSIEASKTADDILTLSSTTGLSTRQLQEFQYASEFVDVSLETMTGSMTKMIKSMDSARDGSKNAADAYAQLGIHITGANGQLRDANTVFYEAIDKLGKMKNETERDAIAMQLFGKSARELNPLIEAGSERLAELSEEARKMGYVMSEDTLNRLGALDDAFQKFDKQSEALKNTLALALLPILTAVMELVSSISPEAIAVVAVIGTVIVMVVAAAKAIQNVTGIISIFTGQGFRTTAMILGIVVALTALAAIIAVIIGKRAELDRAMSSIGNAVGGSTRSVRGYAGGTNASLPGWSWVGENGPELMYLNSGTRIMNNRDARNASAGGVSNYYVTISAKDVREFNDIVRIANSRKSSIRAGYSEG